MPEAFGKYLMKIRKRAGYESLGQLSKASGVSVATLSRIENNIQRPSPETLEKLAPFLDVPYEQLLSASGYLPCSKIKDSPGKVDEPSPIEIEKVLREADIMFDGTPLDEEDKEDVIEFVKLALRAIRKRKRRPREKDIRGK